VVVVRQQQQQKDEKKRRGRRQKAEGRKYKMQAEGRRTAPFGGPFTFTAIASPEKYTIYFTQSSLPPFPFPFPSQILPKIVSF
jgi:hypothetical protein